MRPAAFLAAAVLAGAPVPAGAPESSVRASPISPAVPRGAAHRPPVAHHGSSATPPAVRAFPPRSGRQGPSGSLAVHVSGGWHAFWHGAAAPAAWPGADPVVAAAADWRAVAPGVEQAELRLAGEGAAWRVRAVLARFDPRRVRLEVQLPARRPGERPAWTVDSIPPDAVLAFNAGQFTGYRPWGWVVRGGRELQPPGKGPLSLSLVADSGGGVRLLGPAEADSARARGGVATAFQSYPALLVEHGMVPEPLRLPGRGVNLEHRDSRLALGELRDGRFLVLLTRFDGLGGALEVLPFGPTVPEMAAIMGALGCRRAVLLDGGLSGQLALHPPGGEPRAWRGLRRVPMGLTVAPREAGTPR